MADASTPHAQPQAGAGAVEMALLLPLLPALVFAVIDSSRFFSRRASATMAAKP